MLAVTCGLGGALTIVSPFNSCGYATDSDPMNTGRFTVTLLGGFALPFLATLSVVLRLIAGCLGLVAAVGMFRGSYRVAGAGALVAGVMGGLATYLAALHMSSSGYCCGSYFTVTGAPTAIGTIFAGVGGALMSVASVAHLSESRLRRAADAGRPRGRR